METLKRNFIAVSALTFFLGLSFSGLSQSPKKYLKNGFYEQAFVEAVYKQNKKVKLKKKYTEVIYESYDMVYKSHLKVIKSPEAKWQESINRFLRLNNFLSKVTHPGVFDKLDNPLYDPIALDNIASKFNASNLKDKEIARSFENVANYEKALALYEAVAKRHLEVINITNLQDRLILDDCESQIKNAKQKIGDKYILEARELLNGASKQEAIAAIDLIYKARTYRDLDIEEKELLVLANLIIGESWIAEAEKLLNTRTKKNARTAYALINRARGVRTLSTEEEQFLELAKDLGTTRILVKAKGDKPIHTAESLSGILNKKKSSQWITYYYEENDAETIDFDMEIAAIQPKVVLGDIRKKVTQNTKTVEYWVEEKDATGNTIKVKKTKIVVGMISTISRTKTAHIDWSILLKDRSDGNSAYSEAKETNIEIMHEFVSVESGDVLALPENVQSDVDLDSQPFPTDKEMINQILGIYSKELNAFIKSQKDHLRNINNVIAE